MRIYPDFVEEFAQLTRDPLTRDQKKTLELILQQPPSKPISWSKIRDLLNSLTGADVEDSGNMLCFSVKIGESFRSACLPRAPRDKYASPHMVSVIRDFITTLCHERL
jgi:hypothetical protein